MKYSELKKAIRYESTQRKRIRGGRKEGVKKTWCFINFQPHSIHLRKQLACNVLREKLKIEKFQLQQQKLSFSFWFEIQSNPTFLEIREQVYQQWMEIN